MFHWALDLLSVIYIIVCVYTSAFVWSRVTFVLNGFDNTPTSEPLKTKLFSYQAKPSCKSGTSFLFYAIQIDDAKSDWSTQFLAQKPCMGIKFAAQLWQNWFVQRAALQHKLKSKRKTMFRMMMNVSFLAFRLKKNVALMLMLCCCCVTSLIY